MNALHYALAHKAETVALTKKIIHAKPGDPRPGFVFDEAVRLHMVDPTLPCRWKSSNGSWTSSSRPAS